MRLMLRHVAQPAGLAMTVVSLAASTALAAPTPERGKVVALDKQTGRPAWEAPLWSCPEAAVPPVITAETLYALEDGQRLKALDAVTGRPRWQVAITSNLPLTLAGERIVVVTGDSVRAFNRQTGKQAWQFTANLFPDWKLDAHSVPVLTQDRLLLPAGPTLIALDPANGQPVWAYTVTATHGPLQPAVVRDLVYLRAGPEDQEVRLKLEDGLPDTGEYAVPPDVARAMARQRQQAQKPAATARPAGAKRSSIPVQARVAPGGKLLATVGARRWSFQAPAGWIIDRLAGESPRHLYALVGSAAPAPKTTP